MLQYMLDIKLTVVCMSKFLVVLADKEVALFTEPTVWQDQPKLYTEVRYLRRTSVKL